MFLLLVFPSYAETTPQIPSVWAAFREESDEDFESELSLFDEAQSAYEKALSEWNTREAARQAMCLGTDRAGTNNDSGTELANSDPQPLPPTLDPPSPRMHEDEPCLFLHLATALKILLSRTIDAGAIPHGMRHLQTYLLMYRAVSSSFSSGSPTTSTFHFFSADLR